MFYQIFLKPLLFLFSAERAHHLAIVLLKTGLSIPVFSLFLKKSMSVSKRKNKARELMGLSFENPVGLAAGFDKDGRHFKALKHMGFGFMELGTVTPRPQPGNPRPRLFRLPSDRAIINRMGFNNQGVEALKTRLSNRKNDGLIIGGNIGKNKDTPNEEAVEDYLDCMRGLHPVVDYFTVNMSSPNTPNLRALQDKEPLRNILSRLIAFNTSMKSPRPILLKIAPDLTERQIDDIVEIVHELDLDGVVATNTTISRAGLQTSEEKIKALGDGGLSGAPLTERSRELVSELREKLGSQYVIIGVGGIMSGEDALKMLNAGADLIQVYSGLIYRGPGLIKEICSALERERD
nr:quinone-dependent dihydroorotate dehydrogenase [Saprospiraceae bacterium]